MPHPTQPRPFYKQAQTWPFQLHSLGESPKDIAGKPESKYLYLLIKLYMSHLYNYSYTLEIEDNNKQQLLHLGNHMDGERSRCTVHINSTSTSHQLQASLNIGMIIYKLYTNSCMRAQLVLLMNCGNLLEYRGIQKSVA